MSKPMRYYPVNLDIENKDCLVVGGGEVGERKTEGLLRSGANVTVVTEQATEPLRALAAEGRIALHLKPYDPTDMVGKALVIGATDREEINQQISRDATERAIPCNIVDRPEACSFVLPAVVERGDLVIAVSTSNKSPALARRIRERLESEFGPEYAVLLKLMGVVRKKLLAESGNAADNKKKLEKLLDLGLLDLIRHNRREEIDAALKGVMGDGFTWAGLMNGDQAPGAEGSA